VSLSRDSRTEKKLKALRRAEFRLKQQFDYIDWTEDVLIPEIDSLKAGRPVLGLEAGAMFDIQVADAHTNRSAAAADQAVHASDPRHARAGDRAKSRAPRARLRHRK
jgi:hypothetical protein